MAVVVKSPTVAEQLACFCTGLQLERLPADVVERTKDLLLDYLGVCYQGAQVESSAASLAATQVLAGGSGPATVVGQHAGMQAAWAALVNGVAAHAIEMDDVTSKSSLHPAVAVFPATLAVAEELDASAAATLEAAIAGYEVTMRLGNALNPASAYKRGFHPTGVAGAFGAAAAASSLLRLETAKFTNALGIAGTMAAGSLEYLSGGAWTKRLNAGWAAHCGVVAARLAEQGFTGPATVVEGPLGLLHGYTDEPYPAETTEGLGSVYQVMKVSIKPYGCCRYNHGLIDCMLDIKQRHKFAVDDIEEIRLGVLSGGYLLVADPIEQKQQPHNVVDAQFSAPYAAAVALVAGSAKQADYNQANIDDPRVRGLMSKSVCYRDAELDSVYPDHWPAAASIRLRDGRVLETKQPYPLGEPENPVSASALAGKFRELVDRPFAGEIIERVRVLPAGSIRDLMTGLRR